VGDPDARIPSPRSPARLNPTLTPAPALSRLTPGHGFHGRLHANGKIFVARVL
jgi:hypothetical protein